MTPMAWMVAALALVAGAALGAVGLRLWERKTGKQLVDEARRRAESILQQARRKGERQGKRQADKLRRKAAREIAEIQAEAEKEREAALNLERAMNRRDAALAKREQALDQRAETFAEEEARLRRKEEEIQARRVEVEARIREYQTRLERVAGLTVEDAKRQLLQSLRTQAEREAAMEIRAIKEEAQAKGEAEARKIITLAIERVAVEQVAERTTSQIRLKDESIKGRIIGQDGRNIKAFEAATGMQLMVNNDDPKLVIVSGFNPVAREVARRTLERLIQGGPIQPARIQSLVKRVNKQIKREMDMMPEGVLHPMEESFAKLLGPTVAPAAQQEN